MSAKAPNNGNRELARAVAMMNVADRDRLNYIRKALVQALDGVDQPA
jgi:hypothetical protein